MMPQKYHEVETGSTKSELHNEQPKKKGPVESGAEHYQQTVGLHG
jgi:hypothetical protein